MRDFCQDVTKHPIQANLVRTGRFSSCSTVAALLQHSCSPVAARIGLESPCCMSSPLRLGSPFLLTFCCFFLRLRLQPLRRWRPCALQRSESAALFVLGLGEIPTSAEEDAAGPLCALFIFRLLCISSWHFLLYLFLCDFGFLDYTTGD